MQDKKLYNRYDNQEGKVKRRQAGKGRIRDAFRDLKELVVLGQLGERPLGQRPRVYLDAKETRGLNQVFKTIRHGLVGSLL